jgi:hypothetical protein
MATGRGPIKILQRPRSETSILAAAPAAAAAAAPAAAAPPPPPDPHARTKKSPPIAKLAIAVPEEAPSSLKVGGVFSPCEGYTPRAGFNYGIDSDEEAPRPPVRGAAARRNTRVQQAPSAAAPALPSAAAPAMASAPATASAPAPAPPAPAQPPAPQPARATGFKPQRPLPTPGPYPLGGYPAPPCAPPWYAARKIETRAQNIHLVEMRLSCNIDRILGELSPRLNIHLLYKMLTDPEVGQNYMWLVGQVWLECGRQGALPLLHRILAFSRLRGNHIEWFEERIANRIRVYLEVYENPSSSPGTQHPGTQHSGTQNPAHTTFTGEGETLDQAIVCTIHEAFRALHGRMPEPLWPLQGSPGPLNFGASSGVPSPHHFQRMMSSPNISTDAESNDSPAVKSPILTPIYGNVFSPLGAPPK